ncbi:flagellin [Bacillus sp. 31A1R]|uniref:Flagellin n=1 Tax=Robertmurraya mangrovi TaxID=3098077 RepID=A0ABU5IXQ3_9BACI|nr:flagellin [Bacillus sp. 31A1R]MDZ5471948.1 flagellin [Bacillus sp. 31A1R]
MRINHNIQALNAYRNLYQNQFQTSKNLERLSSGLRINRAADDAAGLAISEKMRSQIRGLKQAERNSMDGISLMQTTEGAMTEVHAMLQRMRELSVQGANDTNTDADRREIQKEVDQLLLEIDSIAEKTEFNTRKLLNGESAVLSVINSNKTGLVKSPEIIDPSLKSGNYELSVEYNPTTDISYNVTQPAGGLKAGDIKLDTSVPNQKFGEYTINIRDYNNDGSNVSAKIQVIGPDGLPINQTPLSVEVGSHLQGGASQFVTVGGLKIDASKIEHAGSVKINIEAKVTLTLSYDQNLGANSIKEAKVFGETVKVPSYNTSDTKSTVGNLLSSPATIGLPNAGLTGGFPTGVSPVAVLTGIPITSDSNNADGTPILTSLKASAESVNFVDYANTTPWSTALNTDMGAVVPPVPGASEVAAADHKNDLIAIGIAAGVKVAKETALTGVTTSQLTDQIKVAAEQAIKEAAIARSIPENKAATYAGALAAALVAAHDGGTPQRTIAEDLTQENNVVAAAASTSGLENQGGKYYFSVETNAGTKLFRLAAQDLGTSNTKPLVNESTGVITFNSNSGANVSLKDIQESLLGAGFTNVKAWEVASAGTEIKDQMLVVTNNTNNPGSPIARNAYTLSTTDYQPVDFRKTVTTVNGKVVHGGAEFSFNSSLKQGFSEFSVTNNSLAFQIGPNTNQNVNIDVPQLNTVELGVEHIDVTSQTGANKAIFDLDQAIQKVSSIRAKLGATQNRLEHTISNIQTTHENLTASESRIRDADMALEMTQFTKNNILNQSAQAMLAQANQLPQGVLQLLQG